MIPVGRSTALRRRHFAASFALVLTACSAGEAAPPDDSDPAARDVPQIYGDFTQEELLDGRNLKREGYTRLLASCQQAGFPTTPLSPEEAALVGTTRVQLWIDNGSARYRVESWDAATPGQAVASCHFQLDRDGFDETTTPHSYQHTDLRTGETESGPSDQPPAGGVGPVDEGPDALATARASGMQGPTRRQIMDQPCDQWRDAQGATQCLWAAGKEWGFGSYTSGLGCGTGPSISAIVLEQTPPEKGMGCRVVTRRFAVETP